jgi:ABC-2 type transport system ATP-binding protein
MNYIEEFCDRIALINRGEVVLHDSIHNIKKSYSTDSVSVTFDAVQNSENIRNAAEEFALSIEPKNSNVNTSDSAYTFIIKLKEQSNKDDLLKKLIGLNYSIEVFHIVEPTLEEIFVEKAGDAI